MDGAVGADGSSSVGGRSSSRGDGRSRSAKRAKRPAAAVAELPAALERLSRLYASTLTAAAFLAPKGVCCTLSTLRSMAPSDPPSSADMRSIVALDSSLALRYHVGPGDALELELVLREALKVLSTPSAVRSRHKRFRVGRRFPLPMTLVG